MASSVYRCACRNCREEQLFDDYDTAQEFFGEHVSRGHEVELLNLAAKTGEGPVRLPEDE
ncbi:hypothetical protein [Halopelagius inordinatus]|uniref:hypothetical protein n=1 Tax=Halopelagius inordinatus TaxID=553467 RepID=UPI000B89294E|nr:hypothetical protein [Halopelagius inordinatus]